ncbi:MAG: hypothetical protein QNJ54_31135 [Prochloraceae cyanobacterium]|nr:hypothetical protein [Prochloraceae cyanobacterium]
MNYPIPQHNSKDIQLIADLQTVSHFDSPAAICDLPPNILCEAITLATENPVDFNTLKAQNLELHPAFRLLCGWWNKLSPNYNRAAHCLVWVRAPHQPNEYLCSYTETKNLDIDFFKENRESVGSCGEEILVLFMQTRSNQPIGNPWPCSLKVDGEIFESFGCDFDNFAPANHGFRGLMEFPQLFPGVWQDLLTDRAKADL